MPSREHPTPHTFETEQWLPYPVEIVFAFFAMPENLPRIMPRWQKARIEEANFVPPPPRPRSSIGLKSFAAGEGTRLSVSFRPFPLCPIRIPWHARITHFDWNNSFCDEQEQGPFAYWNHCHRVREEEQNGVPGTRVTDSVEYALPFGALGQLANTLIVARQMRSTFKYRHKATLLWLERVAAPYRSSQAETGSSLRSE
jgi:ligand-binding SRPBCC domain-containing protein